MHSHYFIGIKTPGTLEDLVQTYTGRYKLDAAYKVIPHVEDLHVTLLFLGAVAEQSLPLLKKNLTTIGEGHPSFNMSVNGLSYFGPSSGPRVVYLSVGESKVLLALQKEIDITVSVQLDKPVSDRFTPHITIAKKRKTTDKLFLQKEKWQPIEIPVSSFSLFKINPEKSPKYEAIESHELRVKNVPGTETTQN